MSRILMKTKSSENIKEKDNIVIEKLNKLINEKTYNTIEDMVRRNLIHDINFEIKKRISMINVKNITIPYISITHDIIEPGSDKEEDKKEEKEKAKTMPTIKDVCENIIDSNIFVKIVK